MELDYEKSGIVYKPHSLVEVGVFATHGFCIALSHSV